MSLSFFPFHLCFFLFVFLFFTFSGNHTKFINERKFNEARRNSEVFVKIKPGQIQVLMGIEHSTKVVRATELSSNREYQILLN